MCRVKVLVREYSINTRARVLMHQTSAYTHKDCYNVRFRVLTPHSLCLNFGNLLLVVCPNCLIWPWSDTNTLGERVRFFSCRALFEGVVFSSVGRWCIQLHFVIPWAFIDQNLHFCRYPLPHPKNANFVLLKMSGLERNPAVEVLWDVNLLAPEFGI
jgi:hypothetical protein